MAQLPRDENDQLAILLEQKYGEHHPQDSHIDYFYVTVMCGPDYNWSDLLAKCNLPQEMKTVDNLKSDWPYFLVVYYETDATERQKEKQLNQVIRKPLLQFFAQDSTNPTHIIISRVCKYTRKIFGSLNTQDIENVLFTEPQTENQHLDYFYLHIKLPSTVQVTLLDIPTMLSKLPGKWKTVKTEETWPPIFFGYFPKEPFESEREREWRLNKQVREPLKEHLNDLLKQKVSILFSRACKYAHA